MASESANLKERLKSFLVQLQTELGILDRIVYKGKNQHRRCLYFQYLLKVRRDVKLLLSADLEQVLNPIFQVINRNKPTQKVHLLERLKKPKHRNAEHNFQERLLGIARLLSQMVEPILKAAIQISSLLAQSFFMGFALTNLAILARLRVLVQQMLLDVVSVFNTVSSLSQEEQSVKLTQEGIQVFREYYPPGGDVLTLECVWERDKFVLHERTSRSKRMNHDVDLEEARPIPSIPSTIQYESIEISNEDDEVECKAIPTIDSIEECLVPADIERQTTNAFLSQPFECNNVDIGNSEDGDGVDDRRSNDETPKGSLVAVANPLPSPKSPKPQAQSMRKVAFVSVRKSASQESNKSRPCKKFKTDILTGNVNDSVDDAEDPFFSLLTGGTVKGTFFN